MRYGNSPHVEIIGKAGETRRQHLLFIDRKIVIGTEPRSHFHQNDEATRLEHAHNVIDKALPILNLEISLTRADVVRRAHADYQ